ncbi:hypothetical protein GGP91_003316 [Salinibacter ruber]|uniref:hypothetical protein n=1 Tax=Salinibacter ruber TaxID=146919 RepID=UPI00216731F6|nr:hypothetical protein [Salinibacter ruber]MCS3831215.1 hypothetical protein [Salinibacter ruber]MCS4057831.1 hypothetical protein [Salinibacter ruber]MCS4061003.1 hypothetical protein [Salinibacter ruber]MCS4162881.1 hypothetical protein [Salinibacter ruber]
MGQQQLLLLVLSTVIVGLATVAGIQAFSENQQQATQDALTQRAISIGSDISAAANQPTQMGGIELGSNGDNASTIASRIGLSSDTGIDADGAGDGASCAITTANTDEAQVDCGSDGANSGDVQVTVTVDPDANNDPVTLSSITVQS